MTFRYKRAFFSVLGLALLVSGCDLVGVFEKPNESLISDLAAWKRENENLFKVYIGNTTEEIESTFGKPKEILKLSKDSISPYDEVWRYNNLPIGSAQIYDFLFKEKRLLYVKVFGQLTTKKG